MSLLDRLLGKDKGRPLSYERARDLASHDDVRVRAELAGRADVVPEILYFLAEDPDPVVRRAIAGNRSTPVQAHLLLADDDSDEVRADLAAQIARLCPELTSHEQDKVRDTAGQVLERLARDQIPRVRRILSETLKDVAAAPPEVIRRLARDVEVAVATPVLEFSPVLTDDDLLEIIAESPVSAKLSAISRRSVVAGRIADAIAATDDVEAIAHLLANKSAQIREETLDSLIERAESQPLWHRPLVERPRLHSRAAARLAQFVADSLLTALAARHDLEPEAMAAVRQVVSQRLSGEGGSDPVRGNGDDPMNGVDFQLETARLKLREAVKRAETLAASPSGLAPVRLMSALAEGDNLFVIAALSVRAQLAADVVATVVEENSAKGMAAVAWKAAMSAHDALALQMQLAGVTPDQAVKPLEDGSFALTEGEMDWQIEMFDDVARQKRPRSLDDALERHG